MKNFLLFILIFLFKFGITVADVNLYGPGGPHGAFLEVGKKFTTKTGIKVNVNFGPDSTWREKAKQNADFIFGTSEQSNQAVLSHFQDQFSYKKSIPLYYRNLVIFVKKGNPKKINSLKDLIKKGTRILVIGSIGGTNTSGTGAWEDAVSRVKKVDFLKKFIENIAENAVNSGSARRSFLDESKKIDALIAFEDWHKTALLDVADVVEIEEEYRISRSLNITPKNNLSKEGKQFLQFILKDKEANEIFTKFGYFK